MWSCTLRVSQCTGSVLCHFGHYVLFSKANTLFCSTAYTTLFKWSRSIVSSVSYKTKQLANEVCFWTHIKRAKTNFFCYKVEVCCERAITFSIKVIWRVTIGLLIINSMAGNMSNCYNLRFRLQSQEADWEHSSTRNSWISVYGHQHFWGWALLGCIPKATETVGGEALNIVSHNPSQK